MTRRPPGWKVIEHMSHKKFLNWGVIVVEDDPDVIHVDNSSDLALSTSLNDLEIAALDIDGQSIDVDAPPYIIDVIDEDDDIIDEEDPIPHDLADSDDEDLVNLDIDDGVNMSADVARGHGGDGGGDDRPPPYQERKAGVVAKIRPSLTCVLTWNSTAGHKYTRASSSTFKRSTMEDETIDTFTIQLTTLVNKAASLGHTMEDGTLVRKLLNVVPNRYLQIVASIEQYSDLSEMTLVEAIGRLKTYEERIKYKKGKKVENQEKLKFTRHENKGKYFRGRGCGKHRFSQGRNHKNFKEEKKDEETSHKNFNKNNFKKSNYDTSKLQCYKCKKIGHIAPKCPQRTKQNEQYNLVEEDLEPALLMAILEDEEQKFSLHEEDVGYKETNKDSLWYLDNGASNHMTGVREHFKELNKKVSGKVRFGDGSYIDIKGKGSILIECDDKKQKIISHVYYIPDLKSNLLSLGQFTEIGCKVVMEDDE
nr:zinc finger, CCHC-type [Tanacetum cinerariifolium]